MSKLVLQDITNVNQVSVINSNSDKIEEYINEAVLSRTNPTDDPNSMEVDLDMNGQRVYNLPEPISPSEAARLQDVQNAISGASAANLVSFTPTGNITSTNVQAAIVEVDSDLRADFASTTDPLKGDFLVGVKQPLTGAVGRTQHDKNKEIVSVKDFGAVGDGITDDTAAIQAALDSGASEVFFPPAPGAFYRITNTLEMNAAIYGLGGRYRNSTIITMDSVIAKPILRGVGADLFLKDVHGISLASVQNRIHTALYGGGYQVKFSDLYIIGMNYGLDIDGVYVTLEDSNITDCNKAVYPAYLRAIHHLPSTMFEFRRCSFISNTYGFHLENRFGAGANEDLINLTFDNVGFELNTHGCVITQRSWNTRVSGCWFEANTTSSYNAPAADTLWLGGNRVDPGDPVPVYCAPNDGFLGTVRIEPRESRLNDLYVRRLFANRAGGEQDYVELASAELRAASIYQGGGTSFQAGSAVTQTFADDSGSARASLKFNRNPSLAGGGARSSSEIRLTAQGSSLSSDSMPERDIAIVRWDGFVSAADNARTLGAAANRWSTVYAGTGAINTSDERCKEQFRDSSEAERRVALAIKGSIRAFKFKDAVVEKGDGARWHFGVGAQTVATAFVAEGLDPHHYGLFCFDEWEEAGDQQAGNRYGIRYDELAMFIISAI